MNKQKNLEHALSQAVTSLASVQQKDGSFLSFSSKDIHNFTNTTGYHSPFATALILLCLNELENSPAVLRIKKRIVAFLVSQKSLYWSFNYWKRNSPEATRQPYPDDLDDTFCALAALYNFDEKILDGTAMGHIIQLLTATEVQEGGPYRTWLVKEDAETVWKDVDLAVNSNIAYFLSLQEITLPNLTAFIEEAIDKREFRSPYYPDDYALVYYLSRFSSGEKAEILKKYLITKRKKDYSWGNPLQTALAVLSLIHVGMPPQLLEKSINSLVVHQRDGLWEPYGFCIDPVQAGVTHYSGSAALTTAFCLAAIASFVQGDKKSHPMNKRSTKNESDVVYKKVVKRAREEFSHLHSELKSEAIRSLEKTISKDTDTQIILLAYFLKRALGKQGEKISEKLIMQLSLASLFGWIAYTIYDDFLDEEGDPKALSVANFSLRQVTRLFNSVLPKNTDFQQLVQKIMNDLDSANAWELAHCRISIRDEILHTKDFRIPKFGSKRQLAQKSLGHALGAVAIFCSLGYAKGSPEIKNLLSFFTNYLIARQLNDDAHDWEEDLRKGQINAVGALLLEKKSELLTNNIAVKTLIPQLQEVFWYELLPVVSKEILQYTKKAKTSLQKITLIQDTKIFEEILVSLEKSAQKALEEQTNAVLFLKTYNAEA